MRLALFWYYGAPYTVKQKDFGRDCMISEIHPGLPHIVIILTYSTLLHEGMDGSVCDSLCYITSPVCFTAALPLSLTFSLASGLETSWARCAMAPASTTICASCRRKGWKRWSHQMQYISPVLIRESIYLIKFTLLMTGKSLPKNSSLLSKTGCWTQWT